MEIDVTLKIKGEEAINAVKSIMAENKKYIRFRKIKDGYICHVSGETNNVRKTINEFLESLMFIEKVEKEIDARVG